ncbi:uncharacterized protein LOC131674463 [Phymastichus coffea]|uniref:uncharacterized protein LOC131674463 n=1 Tax=Phymastichus coffea TaxID=108790 RepID=UPI00273A93D1|nr:uncharacterized protein LOC131674463 [Phymastichus coffea]
MQNISLTNIYFYTKKMMDLEKVEYSPDEVFTNFIDKDKTVELIGYVDQIFAPRDVGRKLEFKLFKFVLSNGTKKVSCVVWNVVAKYEAEIKINRILHITGGMSKNCQVYVKKEEGFVAFEITIMDSTTVDYIGYHNFQDVISTDKAIIVDFDDISNYHGQMITIAGYLKQTFRVIESRFGNMSYGSAAITNGNLKINIDITNYTPLDYKLGARITVTGVFTNTDGLATIQCKEISSIVLDDKSAAMSHTELMKGIKFPKRKTLA